MLGETDAWTISLRDCVSFEYFSNNNTLRYPYPSFFDDLTLTLFYIMSLSWVGGSKRGSEDEIEREIRTRYNIQNG